MPGGMAGPAVGKSVGYEYSGIIFSEGKENQQPYGLKEAATCQAND